MRFSEVGIVDCVDFFHQKRCINAASLAHRKRRSQNQQDVWSVVELIANSFASHFEDPVVIECEVRFGIILCIFIILRLTRRFACFKMQCSVPHHIVTVFCGECKPARVGCPVSGFERWHFRKKRHVRQRQNSVTPPAGTHRIRESRQLFGMDRRQIQSDFFANQPKCCRIRAFFRSQICFRHCPCPFFRLICTLNEQHVDLICFPVKTPNNINDVDIWSFQQFRLFAHDILPFD